MFSESGFTVKYRVRNHIANSRVVIKNKMGMVSEIPYKESFNRSEENTFHIDVEMVIFDFKATRFDLDSVTNSLDKVIVKEIIKRIEEIKRTSNTIHFYKDDLTERVLVNVSLAGIPCNYNLNGYQSDMFGFTLEFKNEAFVGGYKEEEYQNTVENILIDSDVHEEGKPFIRDFVFRMYRIVDNNHSIGHLWVKLGGDVVRVLSIRDKDKSDGIYIYQGTGSKPLKIIAPDEITDVLLTEYGLAKSKLDLEQGPNGKLFTQLNKTLSDYKEKVKALEKELEQVAFKNRETVTKLGNIIADTTFELKEKDRIINRLKEGIKESKDRESMLKSDTAQDHKRELEKVKQDASKNNIGDFLKTLKDVIPALAGIMKLLA